MTNAFFEDRIRSERAVLPGMLKEGLVEVEDKRDGPRVFARRMAPARTDRKNGLIRNLVRSLDCIASQRLRIGEQSKDDQRPYIMSRLMFADSSKPCTVRSVSQAPAH